MVFYPKLESTLPLSILNFSLHCSNQNTQEYICDVFSNLQIEFILK